MSHYGDQDFTETPGTMGFRRVHDEWQRLRSEFLEEHRKNDHTINDRAAHLAAELHDLGFLVARTAITCDEDAARKLEIAACYIDIDDDSPAKANLDDVLRYLRSRPRQG